jgi:hypothetical protein
MIIYSETACFTEMMVQESAHNEIGDSIHCQNEVYSEQLTVKLTQYDLSQTTLGNLPMLRVSQ